MALHGEAGRYKEDNAAAKNEAVTTQFVNKAINLWDNQNRTKQAASLVILSDALHQAEDRGSPGEGNAFSGHDVRITLGQKGKNGQDWAKQNWEEPMGGKIDGKEWDPDSFSVNQKGAVLAVGFAQGVLDKFRQGIKLPEGTGQIGILEEDQPEQRKLKGVTSESALGAIAISIPKWLGGPGASSGGGEETLKKIFEDNKSKWEEAYRNASKLPKDEVPEGFKEMVDEGWKFYAGGIRGKDDYNKD